MPVYVISGANRGLGLEFVRQLAQSSDNTILATTRSLSSDLKDLKGVASKSTHIFELDTGNEESILAFVGKIQDTLGGKKIDYLLNVAGVNSVPQQSSLTIGPSDLQREILINAIGPAKVTQHLLERGSLSDDLRLLNMTSGLGSMEVSKSITPRKCATYSISKAALNMLTVHQSGDIREKLPGVVVIAMDPGWVKTRMGGEGAVLEPEESIGGMLQCLHGLKESDNGKFYQYDGQEKPW
jgi:NAD(P)-dependent dehydrogenase (short-subunit alcohol dehydrogenase family)